MPKKRQTGTPATTALDRAGVPYVVRTYDHDPRAASRSLRRSRSDRLEGYGAEAAEELDVDPARVFKTLLASLDGRLVVGIVPVTGQLDLKALARALGGRKAVMAEVAAAERATGYVAGGISPIGQKRPHPTVLDRSALDHATILVSGGRRGLDVELAPTDLVAITGAIVDQVRVQPGRRAATAWGEEVEGPGPALSGARAAHRPSRNRAALNLLSRWRGGACRDWCRPPPSR